MASFAAPANATLTPEERMNLAALQRRDPYISKVIETASQVALYDYDTTSDAWTNTDVEGSLFLYERVVAPFHGFTISNRKQPYNHWEALNEHVEFQNPEDEHFLLYKNRDKIFGIWFFDQAECRKIGDLARQLVLKTTAATESANQSGAETATGKHGIMKEILSSSSSATSSGGGGGGDIISLLFKAQHEYNQNNNNNTVAHSAIQASPSTKQVSNQQLPSQPGGVASIQQPPPPPQRPTQLPTQVANQPHQPSSILGDPPPPPHSAETKSDGPKSISLSSLFANAKSQQQRDMKLPTIPASVVSCSSLGAAAFTAPSAGLAAPPPVFTAPITAPITAPPFDYPSSKPAFVPLDDNVEPNALQMFVQKMKIQENGNTKENALADNVKPLPLRIDGGPGVASRRRKDPPSKHKIHRNSVPSHSPPSIEKLPQIPPHFTNSNSSGMAPSSDSPSPSSPLSNKPLAAGFSLLTPDAFEDASLQQGNHLPKNSKGRSVSTSAAATVPTPSVHHSGAAAANGGVASKLAATLIRSSLVMTSDDDVALERNSSDDVFGNDADDDVGNDEDSDDVVVGGGGYGEGRRSGNRGSNAGGQPHRVGEEVAGLTKEQLRSTLVHLLQSDNDFLETIHAGYVACLKAPKSKKRHGYGKK